MTDPQDLIDTILNIIDTATNTIGLIFIPIIIIIIFGIFLISSWYRIVPPSEAHLIITRKEKMLITSDDSISKDGKKTYFAIPENILFFGRHIRKIDLTIKELLIENQETYEKDQARFMVKSSTKYRVADVMKAAETFTRETDLEKQLNEVIQAAIRAVTVKYNVVDARSEKSKMEKEIRNEVTDDLDAWGLELINFQLIDFKDTHESSIISDISKRREVEIESTTRQQNAEMKKDARMKEAEADEKATKREIEKDRTIEESEQEKIQLVAIKQQEAEEAKYEVIKVQTLKQAEITKEQAIIKAKENQETEKINLETKRLEGEGDKLKATEQAIGDAAKIKEEYLAEAEGKEKLQEALNKFTDRAIEALTAELKINMQKEVGIETAKALSKADVRLFAGNKDGKQAFDLGQIVSAAQFSNKELATALANKIGRPNDLGFKSLLSEISEEDDKTPKDVEKVVNVNEIIENKIEENKEKLIDDFIPENIDEDEVKSNTD